MASYIRCPECGNTIGKYLEFLDKAKASLYDDKVFNSKNKLSQYDPEKLFFNPTDMPSLEQIFNAINMKKECCRMHSNNRVNFETLHK